MPRPIAMPAVPLTVQQPVSTSQIEDQQTSPVAKSSVKEDHFDEEAGNSSPLQPNIEQLANTAVQRFSLQIEEKKRVRLIADAVVACVAPFLSSKGTFEDQVGLIMLKLLGKIASERRDQEVDMNYADQLQKAITAEQDKLSRSQKQRLAQSLGQLQKTVEKLQNAHQAIGEDENRVLQGFSSISANQHQTIMASLREIRGL